jgi:hypothetical protein
MNVYTQNGIVPQGTFAVVERPDLLDFHRLLYALRIDFAS